MSVPLWDLPSPSAFVARIVADTDEGRSVAVIQPTAGTPAGLHGAVKAAAGTARTWDALRLGPGGDLGDGPIVDALHEIFGLEVADPGGRLDAAALAAHPSWTHRLVWVNAYDTDTDTFARWVRFLDEYTAATRPQPAHERSLFVTACTGAQAAALPAEDVTALTHRWWFGVLDRLDTAVHVASAARGRSLDPALRAAIVEVAAFDLALADELLTSWKGDVDALPALITGYAADVGLNARTELPDLPVEAEVPDGTLLQMWGEGLAEAWDAHPSWHRAAVNVDGTVAGGAAAAWWYHLVWRAQLATLLPDVEAARHQVALWCEAMRPHLRGDEFATCDIVPLEYGRLRTLMNQLPHGRRDRERRELLDWLYGARNSLAHAQVLGPADIEQGRRLLGRSYRRPDPPPRR